MSSFVCEKCGKNIIDSPNGYITNCKHYPEDKGVTMSTESEIINQTMKVREMQKHYFSSRSKNALYNSKLEEIKLDNMITDYLKIKENKNHKNQ